MPKYSAISIQRLATCNDKLQKIFNEVIKNYDCTILEGHRNKEDQNKAFSEGRSKLAWPKGQHNSIPSKAVDVAPYPIDFGDNAKTSTQRLKVLARFYHFAGYVQSVADSMGIKIRWGGDWDSDKIFDDQSFDDLPHFELSD